MHVWWFLFEYGQSKKSFKRLYNTRIQFMSLQDENKIVFTSFTTNLHLSNDVMRFSVARNPK